jgi:hypothetical protein
MSRLISERRFRKPVLVFACIVACIALWAYAADDGVVVDIGASSGNAVNATADSGVGGRFTGLFGLQTYGTTYGGLFQDTDGTGSVILAQGHTGILANGALLGIDADGGSSGVGGEFSGGWGVRAYGLNYGGYFEDTNGTGRATLAQGNTGVSASGLSLGIYAEASGSSSIGGEFHGEYGVIAYGLGYGGFFTDTNGTGRATLAQHHVGVTATGMDKGIYAEASGSSSIGGEFHGDFGIQAYGLNYGGYFKDSNGTSTVRLAQDDVGINTLGLATGIYAEASSPTVGTGGEFHGAHGIKAYGSTYAGLFEDSNDNTVVKLAEGTTGVSVTDSVIGVYAVASGASSVAGWFDGDNGRVELGIGDKGVSISDLAGAGSLYYGVYSITPHSSSTSGYFDGGMYGVQGIGVTGVEGEGSIGGVYGTGVSWGVRAHSGTTTVTLPQDLATLQGNGPVGTIQNHPYSKDLVVVSHAPVGDEFATYTRGSARLEGGEAVIRLSEAFRVTTNPDYGLTAHLTPVGDWADLYIAEKTTDRIVVRSRSADPSATFDYQVWGLRIGFEEAPILREKTEDAGLPSMDVVHQMHQRRPDLQQHAAMRRYVDAESTDIDLSRSKALIEAIGVHKPEQPIPVAKGGSETVQSPEVVDLNQRSAAEPTTQPSPTGVLTGVREGEILPGRSPDIRARSFQPSLSELARHHSVRGEAEPGDVLVASTDGSGVFLRSNVEIDAAVVGVVASAPGLVLGSGADDAAQGEEYQLPVALAGIADVKVDADYGPIAVGDLLVTSPTPGHAMRDSAALPGTVLGKALQSLDAGCGMIQVLIMLR